MYVYIYICLYVNVYVFKHAHETDTGLGQVSKWYVVRIIFDPSHYLFQFLCANHETDTGLGQISNLCGNEPAIFWPTPIFVSSLANYFLRTVFFWQKRKREKGPRVPAIYTRNGWVEKHWPAWAGIKKARSVHHNKRVDDYKTCSRRLQPLEAIAPMCMPYLTMWWPQHPHG